jgi:hypothetical protein
MTQGQKEGCLKFYVTNLGRDQIILGYPWLAAFNLEISWAEGRIRGPKVQIKTTALVAKEHTNATINARQNP